ncbi:unnamed protein product [Staurois parvus]|uniref:Core Histone H2A/H2B/H3 domain-containing protein n=1 Tax=Staurois parvus TaxID=386267 RepID=A0ABN9DW43_9NEOB|nr:unnamed protein product [Staurois parvus]
MVFCYSIYFFLRVSKSISSKAMSIMNFFVNDIFELLAGEASHLAHYKCFTITSQDIQTAVHLLLPKELAKHTKSKGTKAFTKYTSGK